MQKETKLFEVRKELERLNAFRKAAVRSKREKATKWSRRLIKTMNENFKNQNEKKVLITLIHE